MGQPEQRLISMYYYFGALGFYGVDNETSRAWVYDTESPSLREYAEWNGGCTVRQLTMDVLEPYATVPLPTSEDVSVAINVLQEGFAFVGITEQWDLSVCLFRAMFGGQCHSSISQINCIAIIRLSSHGQQCQHGHHSTCIAIILLSSDRRLAASPAVPI